MTESVKVDDTDRSVIRALQLAPRGSFSAIGQVLGLSEQTIARRYRKLRQEGVLRVVAAVSPEALGQSAWVVRLQCRPDGTVAIAGALARRDDVSWVQLVSGGAEVICSLLARSSEQRDELLIQRLPRTAPVLGIAAAMRLHNFVGERSDDFAGLSVQLTAGQSARLAALAGGSGDAPAPGEVPAAGERATRLEPGDQPLVDVLVRSGRATYAELASASGISEGRAARRLALLLASGAVYLDVDVSAPLLGFPVSAHLWLTISPPLLDQAGQALAGFQEVAFAAAITGPHNLTASVICASTDHLYEFATKRIGQLPGVQALEISPVLRRVKQSWAIVSGDRLVDRA